MDHLLYNFGDEPEHDFKSWFFHSFGKFLCHVPKLPSFFASSAGPYILFFQDA